MPETARFPNEGPRFLCHSRNLPGPLDDSPVFSVISVRVCVCESASRRSSRKSFRANIDVMWNGGHCSHQHADHGGDDAHTGPELGIQYTLYTKIDIENVQCLNEAVEGSGKTVFKPWDERLDFDRVSFRCFFFVSVSW